MENIQTGLDRVAALLAASKRGFSLPQAFYIDRTMFEVELEAIFAADWLFACNVSELKHPGDWITMQVGPNSIIVVRDRHGEIRAFHNSCRHRGSRVCTGDKGRSARLVCPYHKWVYELNGSLLHAREMSPDFDKTGYGLKPVHVEVIAGLVYVSMADDPPSLATFRDAVTPFIVPHAPERTKLAFESTIIEDANWKLVIENNRECYHCSGNHPELMTTLVEFALPGDPRGGERFDRLMSSAAAKWDACGIPHRPADGGNEFRCIRLPFNEGGLSFTRDGGAACKKLLGDLTDPALGSARMFRVPNNWNHFLADHMINFRVLPISESKTAVRTTWFVHEDAVEGIDFDIERLTEVWIATNDQDRRLAENNHLGVASRAYRPGPHMPSEFMLDHFSDWYTGKMRQFVQRPLRSLAAAE